MQNRRQKISPLREPVLLQKQDNFKKQPRLIKYKRGNVLKSWAEIHPTLAFL